MKFTATALFLGCTATACWLAVRSASFNLQPVASVAFFHLDRSPLRQLAGIFGARLTPMCSIASPEKGATGISAKPLPSKAETLSLIADAAARYRVPAAFVTSIVAAESNFDCQAVSKKGAIGLMQLMPETAKQFGADPGVPEQNIDAGTHYLRVLMERYQKRRKSIQHVIAAYNAGPGVVDHYRGVPPFRETRIYVARVLRFLKRFSA